MVDTQELLNRLRGIYTTPVNDGAGLLDGKDTFTRSFDTPPICKEAANCIEALTAQLEEARTRNESLEHEVNYIARVAASYAGCKCDSGDDAPGDCWPCRMMDISERLTNAIAISQLTLQRKQASLNKEINHFEAEARFYISGRGIIFSGRAPFEINFPEDKERVYQRPWKIIHESTTAELWRVIEIEMQGGMPIQKGRSIGLLVKKWQPKNDELKQ